MAAGLPTAILVEVEFTAGVWTDIASHVVGDSIEIRVGRESAASDSQPGTLSLTLDNADGQWTPDNPTSVRFPNWVEGKRIRVRVTKGTTSTRFVGRITSIVPDFPTEPSQSRVQVQAVDGLGSLATVNMFDLPTTLALGNSTCIAYYPLTDKVARDGAADIKGGLRDIVVRNVSTSSGSADFAADNTGTVDGLEFPTLTNGKGLWHSGPAFAIDPASSPTVCAIIKVTDGSYGEALSVSVGNRNGASTYLSVQWTSSGFRLDSYVNNTSGTPTATSSDIIASAGWHYVSLNISSSDATLFIDEQSIGSGALSLTDSFTCVSFGGSISMSAGLLAITSSGGGTPYQSGDVFGARSSTSSYTLGQAGLSLQTAAGFTNIAIDASSNRLSTPLRAAGRTAFDVLLDIVRSESGYGYAVYSTSATQTMLVLDRVDRYPTTVALTVDAELDANGAPVLAREASAVAGVARATSSTSEAVYISSSLASLGSSGETVETVLWDQTELFAAAQSAVAAGADLSTRIQSLVVDLSTASNDLYASFFALTPGERVRLSNLPSTYFGVTYMDGYVEGWTERPGVTGYEVTFDLSPADAPSEGLWDDSTYGRWGWGDGICTLSSGITDSATSITLTWTGSATLSTSAGDYPLDIDLNGERITLPSAPAGGTSPRTFTGVTRGVAPTVARAHNAGETVEIWNAARWAM